MDYLQAIDISASGMDYQKLRLEIIANNIANMQTTAAGGVGLYQPLEAVASTSFDAALNQISGGELKGVTNVEVVAQNVEPKLVYNPGHPDANEDGFVAMPNVDLSASMVDLITATRAYEANVKVLNAAKTMALRALEIGQ